MNLEFKIPTLLGLAIITAGVAAGAVMTSTHQTFVSFANPSLAPKSSEIANITATSAAIFWETDSETTGFVQAGKSPNLEQAFQDDRDHTALADHRLHFVTLTNLSPDTTYYYKIHSGDTVYPPGKPLSFHTALPVPLTDILPVVGSVVDSNSQPVTEAIVTLELPGVQKLATVTKTAGSFALPLNQIYNEKLTEAFPINSTSATLKLFNGQKSSQVTIKLPAEPLPPIVIGQDLDTIQSGTAPAASKFDVNGDGAVNSLDLSLILKNTGKTAYLKQADLNGDGVVSKADLEQFVDYLSSQPHNPN